MLVEIALFRDPSQTHLTQESKKKAANLLTGLTAEARDCHAPVTFPDVMKATAAN
jgi:hypothetical protein